MALESSQSGPLEKMPFKCSYLKKWVANTQEISYTSGRRVVDGIAALELNWGALIKNENYHSLLFQIFTATLKTSKFSVYMFTIISHGSVG